VDSLTPEKVLSKAGMKVDQIDLFEINERFLGEEEIGFPA